MLQIEQRYCFSTFETLALTAWQELPELQEQPCAAFCLGALDSVYEDAVQLIGMLDGKPVAIAFLAPDEDYHVGDCISVQWNYCLPEARGLGWWGMVQKALYEMAAGRKVPAAYTRRVGTGQYLTTYKTLRQVLELEAGNGQED